MFASAIRSLASSRRDAAVVLTAETGEFNAKVEQAERQWRESLGSMSKEAIRLDLAQDRLRASLAKYGAESNQAKRATIQLKDAEEQAVRAANRLGDAHARAGRFNTGFVAGLGSMRGGILGATGSLLGGAGLVYGLQRVVAVAGEAQQVLGQTKVAVEAAGLSWERNGRRIEEAIGRQSRALGFDDEELLRTFQMFVRQTRDVDVALQRNALAADVARGMYIDLEQAAQLVTKAALGQTGALRRAGIDIERNASRYEALTTLQRQFGNAAEEAADDAVTSQQRLQVALENTEQSLGNLLLPAVSEGATIFADAAGKVDMFAAALGRLGRVKLPSVELPVVPDSGGWRLAGIAKEWALQVSPFGGARRTQLLWNLLFGGDQDEAPPSTGLPLGEGAADKARIQGLGQLTPTRTPRPPGPRTALPRDLIEAGLLAELSPGDSDDLREARRQRAFWQTQLTKAKKGTEVYTQLLQQLVSANGRVESIEDQLAAEQKRHDEQIAETRRREAERRRAYLEQQARLVEKTLRGEGAYARLHSGFSPIGVDPSKLNQPPGQKPGGLTDADIARRFRDFLVKFDELHRRYAGTDARPNVTVHNHQHFPEPTPDRHMEARYARFAMEAAFDG